MTFNFGKRLVWQTAGSVLLLGVDPPVAFCVGDSQGIAGYCAGFVELVLGRLFFKNSSHPLSPFLAYDV